jgi:hypothetical protein
MSPGWELCLQQWVMCKKPQVICKIQTKYKHKYEMFAVTLESQVKEDHNLRTCGVTTSSNATDSTAGKATVNCSWTVCSSSTASVFSIHQPQQSCHFYTTLRKLCSWFSVLNPLHIKTVKVILSLCLSTELYRGSGGNAKLNGHGQVHDPATLSAIGVQFSAGAMIEIFLFAKASRPTMGPTQPPIQLVPGALIPTARTKFKNAWSYTSIPTYVFISWYLLKHNGAKFTFYIHPLNRRLNGPQTWPRHDGGMKENTALAGNRDQ